MKVVCLVACLFLVSCARQSIKTPQESMRLSKKKVELVDSLSEESFFIALGKHIEGIKKTSLVPEVMVFGPRSIQKELYIQKLEEIYLNQLNWKDYIKDNFDFYEVYGNKDWAEVMITGYYEPWVRGSKKESKEFSRALYKEPSDLITVNLKNFSHRFSETENLGLLQGRIENQRLVPYFDRKEIDEKSALKGRRLELAWVSPVDAFFIQIQGSGVVELDSGEIMRVGYANQNGHSYRPIGRFLLNHIPLEEMSMQRIKLHLNTLSMGEQQRILSLNPSYVFFQPLLGESLTYSGIEVEVGRTIATDRFLFPKGAMGFLEVNEPIFANEDDIVPVEYLKRSRFVFDQDTGGAIRGAGRVDLYMGKGNQAAQKAGVMKDPGRLFYLVPKS